MDTNFDVNKLYKRTCVDAYIASERIEKAAQEAGYTDKLIRAMIYSAGQADAYNRQNKRIKELRQEIGRLHNLLNEKHSPDNGKLDEILEAIKAISAPCTDVVQEVES